MTLNPGRQVQTTHVFPMFIFFLLLRVGIEHSVCLDEPRDTLLNSPFLSVHGANSFIRRVFGYLACSFPLSEYIFLLLNVVFDSTCPIPRSPITPITFPIPIFV